MWPGHSLTSYTYLLLDVTRTNFILWFTVTVIAETVTGIVTVTVSTRTTIVTRRDVVGTRRLEDVMEEIEKIVVAAVTVDEMVLTLNGKKMTTGL